MITTTLPAIPHTVISRHFITNQKPASIPLTPDVFFASSALPPKAIKQEIVIPQSKAWQAHINNPGAVLLPSGHIQMLYGAHFLPSTPDERVPNNRPKSTLPNGQAAYSNIGSARLNQHDLSVTQAPANPTPIPIVDKHIDGWPDPRITPIPQADGETVYIITYNAVDTSKIDRKKSAAKTGKIHGAWIHATTTTDFKTYTPPIHIGPHHYEKNGLFFPKIFKGDDEKPILYFMHRAFPNIQITSIPIHPRHIAKSLQVMADDEVKQAIYNDDAVKRDTMMTPLFDWEGKINGSKGQICGGAPPVAVTLPNQKKAWLLIYNGANSNSTNHVDLGRKVGAALLDYKNPRKVIARSPKPIISATEPFELGSIKTSLETNGTVSNVTFATGAISQPKQDTLTVFYGARDEAIGTAVFKLSTLLAYLTTFDATGKPVSTG